MTPCAGRGSFSSQQRFYEQNRVKAKVGEHFVFVIFLTGQSNVIGISQKQDSENSLQKRSPQKSWFNSYRCFHTSHTSVSSRSTVSLYEVLWSKNLESSSMTRWTTWCWKFAPAFHHSETPFHPQVSTPHPLI